MQGSQYDLDEIIAEIKGQSAQAAPPAELDTDGEKTSPHPESAALCEDESKPECIITETVGTPADEPTDTADAEDAENAEDTDAEIAESESTEQDDMRADDARAESDSADSKEHISPDESAPSPKNEPSKYQKAKTPKKLRLPIKLKKSNRDCSHQSDGIEHQTDEDSERRFPYDFVNRTYQDPDEALHSITSRLPGMGLRLLVLFPVWLISLYMTLAFPLKLPDRKSVV